MAPIAFPFFILFFLYPQQIQCRRLRVATLKVDPYVTEKFDGGYEGFLVDLMNDLMERANVGTGEDLHYSFYMAPDGSYGQMDQNGRWNGLMGEVVNGQADMAVAAITVTKARLQTVYFSHPFMSSVVVPLVKKPNPGAHLPFTNLTDLYTRQQSGALSVGYVQHGSTEIYMSEHKSRLIRNIYNISKGANSESPYVDNYEQGVNRVRSSNGRFVFYGDHPNMQKLAQTGPCDVMVAWEGSLGVRTYAFIFPRSTSGLELMEMINELLVGAEEDGSISMLGYRWWEQKATCPIKPQLCMCHNETGH